MLAITQLNQFYGQSHTLWDLDLHIPRGACFSLMGRNGVGKTTLLQCIMGLLPVQSGAMALAARGLRPAAAAVRHFGEFDYQARSWPRALAGWCRTARPAPLSTSTPATWCVATPASTSRPSPPRTARPIRCWIHRVVPT